MSLVPPTPNPAEPQAEARILVVDDDEANRESLARRLRRRGMTADVACGGVEALAMIEAVEYDLVLLDVMMPGLSGLEVLQRVRATKPPTQLPIIMATANDTPADIAEALKLGANDYVTKPIDFTVAFARVNSALVIRRSVRQVFALERSLSLRNAELENAVEALRRSADRAKSDLELAARVQATFLPRDLPADPRYRVAWRYLPCDQLAGDALNVVPLGRDHVGFYVLDVTGHGVASSLTAVTAARVMAPAHDPASILVGPAGPLGPADAMMALARRFSFDADTGQFITVFYALLDVHTGELQYVSAGHPDAIVVPADGPPRHLEGTGLPIGLSEAYDQQATAVTPGDRVWLFSDGIIEAMSPDGTLFGLERLTETLAGLRDHAIDAAPDALLRILTDWRANADSVDDVSVLTFERVGTPA